MATYRSIILAESGVNFFYEAGEVAGSTVPTDQSANAVPATYVGSPTLAVAGLPAGDGITACTLNGTTQYLHVNDHAKLDVGDDFSLEIWFKRGRTATQEALICRDVSYEVRFNASNQIVFQKFGTGAIMTSTATVTDTTNWHHVVCTKNGSSGAAIYLDGRDISTGFTDRTIADGTTGLSIGRDENNTNYFQGTVTRIALYDSVLSSDRVMVHYKAGLIELGVPDTFDVLIDGNGYRLYEPWTGGESSNAPAKATFALTPTFSPRQNTQGYGDDQQDFWLTHAQKDWSLGEQQKYQGRTDDTKRRYWRGASVDSLTPGQVTLRRAMRGLTFSEAVSQAIGISGHIAVATGSTKAFTVDAVGNITDRGAHGVGSEPTGLAYDRKAVYMSSTVGTKVIRLSATAYTFSTFSTSPSDALAYLNNALYGADPQHLYQYNTAGTRSTVFTWQGADGTTEGDTTQLLALGGKLLILRGDASNENPGQLWIYDGIGTSQIAEFPQGFLVKNLVQVNGVVYISGVYRRIASDGTTLQGQPAILYYANGTIGQVWRGDDWASSLKAPGISAWQDGLLFSDRQSSRLLFYDQAAGGISSIGTFSPTGTSHTSIGAASAFALIVSGVTDAYLYPDHSTVATSGTVTDSLLDFDSSLTKLFRGIKVDFDSATDGDGGSVDIAYRVGDVDGTYTTLKTGAVSGTEYLLPNSTTGRSISPKVTLNKGTSTSGPVLKRRYARAAPLQPQYRRQEYVIDCTGRDGKTHVTTRSGRQIPRDGLTMFQNLRTAAASSTPIYIYDELGGYTAVIEADTLQGYRIRPEEYVVRFVAREV